jgi:hypothetical protein
VQIGLCCRRGVRMTTTPPVATAGFVAVSKPALTAHPTFLVTPSLYLNVLQTQ